MDALREAGAALGADRLDVSRTRTVLVRTMESMGETYPAEVLQNYENRMRISEALRYCARQSAGPHASRTHLKLCPVGTMTPSFVLWQSDSVRGRRVSGLSLAQFDSGMKSVAPRGGVSPPCLGRAGRTALRATLFKWETKRRENKIVRCPYCVEGGEFKVMAQQGADEWFICASCGHLALPSNWLLECTCRKCERLGLNATNKSEPRALVGG